MRANFQVVLDACVLCNYTLCDLLLRLAEPPPLYLPRWSTEIMEETTRVMREHLQWPENLVASFEAALEEHFEDCWVKDYELLTPGMPNDAKDRHVLAAAVRCGAQTIVTLNLRHFQKQHLEPLGIDAQHPDQFLEHLFSLDPLIVSRKVGEIIAKRGLSADAYLRRVEPLCPNFVELIRANVFPN